MFTTTSPLTTSPLIGDNMKTILRSFDNKLTKVFEIDPRLVKFFNNNKDGFLKSFQSKLPTGYELHIDENNFVVCSANNGYRNFFLENIQFLIAYYKRQFKVTHDKTPPKDHFNYISKVYWYKNTLLSELYSKNHSHLSLQYKLPAERDFEEFTSELEKWIDNLEYDLLTYFYTPENWFFISEIPESYEEFKEMGKEKEYNKGITYDMEIAFAEFKDEETFLTGIEEDEFDDDGKYPPFINIASSWNFLNFVEKGLYSYLTLPLMRINMIGTEEFNRSEEERNMHQFLTMWKGKFDKNSEERLSSTYKPISEESEEDEEFVFNKTSWNKLPNWERDLSPVHYPKL